ncbi:hypothetical protein [Streptomyces sp. SM11]|uniref:hypothetical protein n=1 Tax=Streptomyces sp. SM11 TaxID=565557 RepID=UPI0011B0627E|nr:hypothetical protein [Streptomyces sp. SM11]
METEPSTTEVLREDPPLPTQSSDATASPVPTTVALAQVQTSGEATPIARIGPPEDEPTSDLLAILAVLLLIVIIIPAAAAAASSTGSGKKR